MAGATAAAATVVQQSFGQMAMASGASHAALAAAFGEAIEAGQTRPTQGQTDYYPGKYDHIRDGVARHAARMVDQAATAARAAAAAPVTAPELSDKRLICYWSIWEGD